MVIICIYICIGSIDTHYMTLHSYTLTPVHITDTLKEYINCITYTHE